MEQKRAACISALHAGMERGAALCFRRERAVTLKWQHSTFLATVLEDYLWSTKLRINK